MHVRPKKRGLGRHFEGWQPALVALLIAASTAAVVVPRPVEPDELPEPRLDMAALGRLAHEDEKLAKEAARAPLDVDVRELGSAFRAYGLAASEGDETEFVARRNALVLAAAKARARGLEEVLRLRAYQLESFLREVRTWARTGEESEELRELGGAFVRTLASTRPHEGKPPFAGALDEAALRASFKRRFREATALEDKELGLSLAENRALYRFLLRNPPASSHADDARGRAMKVAFDGQFRLKKLDELAAVDPAYPKELARGIELYRMGRYVQAADAFRLHLDNAEDGPSTLRTRNHLRAALGRMTTP